MQFGMRQLANLVKYAFLMLDKFDCLVNMHLDINQFDYLSTYAF